MIFTESHEVVLINQWEIFVQAGDHIGVVGTKSCHRFRNIVHSVIFFYILLLYNAEFPPHGIGVLLNFLIGGIVFYFIIY